MKRWALIQNNLVATVTEQETQPTIEGLWVECIGTNSQPGCKYINDEFLPPDPSPVILSKIQIIELLGNDYNSIVSLSKTDVDIEVWLEKFRLTEIFDVSNQTVISDIQFLVSKNLITQQKANTILNQ